MHTLYSVIPFLQCHYCFVFVATRLTVNEIIEIARGKRNVDVEIPWYIFISDHQCYTWYKSKKYRYQAIKQKEQSKLKIQKTRLSHLWNQMGNQVLRKGRHFLLCMRHPSWCPVCHIKDWNVFMTTISWPTDAISHGGHWDTIRGCQLMVTTKQLFNYWSQSSVYEILTEKLVNRTDRCRKYW